MDNQRSEKIMEEYREEVSDLRRKSYPKMSLNEAVKIASEYMLNHYSKEELKEAIINDKQMQLFGMEKSWLSALGKAKKMANGSTVKGGLFTIEKGVKLKRGDKLEFTDEKIHPLTYIEKEGQMAYTRHSSHPTKKDAERVSEGLSKNFYNVIVPSKGEYVVYKNLFNTLAKAD
mgnify:CR=1 FL=1